MASPMRPSFMDERLFASLKRRWTLKTQADSSKGWPRLLALAHQPLAGGASSPRHGSGAQRRGGAPTRVHLASLLHDSGGSERSAVRFGAGDSAFQNQCAGGKQATHSCHLDCSKFAMSSCVPSAEEECFPTFLRRRHETRPTSAESHFVRPNAGSCHAWGDLRLLVV